MNKVIEVKNLGKKFRLRAGRGPSLKATVIDRILHRQTRQDFWALKNISFEVARGEVLGIIGPNGAGKTTLLSLLARTMIPTAGSLEVRGKVSSLLELGAGFHPDLTGRENIYLNASIMGIPRAVISEKFGEIVQFSGLGHFIETPIRFYSSGMIVRLGFSVAVEVDPDILLVDEVLAVGDESFQEKSERRIEKFKNSGKTIVVVSHDMNMIRRFCQRVLHLAAGQVIRAGPAPEVVEGYISGVKPAPDRERAGDGIRHEWGNREVEIRQVRFPGRKEEATPTFQPEEEVVLTIDFFAHKKIKDPVFGFALHDDQFTLCFGSNTQMEDFRIAEIEGKGRMTLRLGPLPLLAGRYYISLSIHSQDHALSYHRQDFFYPISIVSPHPGAGILRAPVKWNLEAENSREP